jgi:Family of unknown function (DUF6941)
MTEAGSPAPRCLTLILCDVLIMDRVTNKPSIIGATINLDAPGFPATSGPLWVFTEFTNGHGRFDFALRIMDPDERPVFQSGFQIMLGNPLDIANMAVQITMVKFPRAGTYRLEIVDKDGVPQIDRRVNVRQVVSQGPMRG